MKVNEVVEFLTKLKGEKEDLDFDFISGSGLSWELYQDKLTGNFQVIEDNKNKIVRIRIK